MTARKIKSVRLIKPARKAAEPRERYHIEAIQRGLDILQLFNADRWQMSLAEITRLTQTVPSTTLRIVSTLRDMSFIEEIGQSLYTPGVAVLRLGHAMIKGSRLRAVARASLERLRNGVGETVGLCILSGASVWMIDEARATTPLAIHFPIGTRLPALRSAAGKAMLSLAGAEAVDAALAGDDGAIDRSAFRAGLGIAQSLGYAMQDEELAGGLRSVAAPIVDRDRRAVGAVAVAAVASRYDSTELARDVAPVVVGVAAEIGARWRADVSAEPIAMGAEAPPSEAPPDEAEPDGRSRYHVEALARGLTVLSAFSTAAPRQTLSELSRRTGDLPSTVFRVIATLGNIGIIQSDKADGRYELTGGALGLGYDALATMELKDLLRPRLVQLQEQTGESIYLSVLAGTEAFDVLSMPRHGARATAGQRAPLYCTPGGKVLLAFMPGDEAQAILEKIELVPRGPKTMTDRTALIREIQATRDNGYSLVDEESMPGAYGVGVPIFGEGQRCVATLAMPVSSARISLATLTKEILPLVRAAGDDLSQRLKWRFE